MTSYKSRLHACLIALWSVLGCNLSDPLDTPPGANSEVDGGAPSCGDGVIGPGETCDGDCPTCDDDDPCTDDAVAGAAATCDVECTNTSIPGCAADRCGNGTVDGGETCDGDCPTCDDGDICTDDVTTGAPETCDVECSYPTISDCVDPADCGNGTLDPGETCDGDCPTCDDGDICTTDTVAGDSSTCNVVCANTPIPSCVDPSECGNGVLDPGEICDGNCPNCDDGDACTADVTVGSAATCNAACVNDPITACTNGDGCCPAACEFATDDDCPCVPTTCADAGYQCGVLDDGCGQSLVCGPCAQYESCLGTQCMASLGTGDPCVSIGDCPQTGECLLETTEGWPGGYCTRSCSVDADCPFGTDCTAGVCAQSCTDVSECRAGYDCADWDLDSDAECAPTGSGPNDVGESCLRISDCSGGVGARCQPELPDGRWEGGFCGLTCVSDPDCPTGAHCGPGGKCNDGCVSSVECRAGYRCLDANADGRTECWGTLDRAVGDACETAEQCAIWNPPLPTGCLTESSSDLPGGICTANCPNGDIDCPAGSHCSENLCLASCSSDAECRGPEYQCFDRDGDSRTECEAVGSGTGLVGTPCSLRSDCAGGQAATCQPESADGAWEGGACLLNCTTDGDCPASTHCYGSVACLPDCATNNDCRDPGFTCIDADGDSRAECFGGFRRNVGEPCRSSTDCGGVGVSADCLLDSRYVGGYCSSACTNDTECPTGSTCYNSTWCELTCQSTADCRPGYNCVDADADGDSECHP